MVCNPPQKLAKAQKYKKKTIKTIQMKISRKMKIKKPLDYVLKKIPAKFGDDQSILRRRKLGMINRDRRTYRLFLHWLILGPAGLTRTKFFFMSIKENQRRKRCTIIRTQGFGRIKMYEKSKKLSTKNAITSKPMKIFSTNFDTTI